MSANLLSGTRDWSGSWDNTWAWSADGTHDGFAVMSRGEPWSGLYKPVKLTAGHTYTFSACVKVEPGENHTANIYISNGDTVNDTYLANSEVIPNMASFDNIADGKWHVISLTFTPKVSKKDVLARIEGIGGYKLSVCAYMLVEGDTPAAWAPAEGETLAGGGALMSANLLDGATVTRGTKDSDGYWVLSQNDGTDKKDSPMWRIDGQPTLTENQTVHMACSVMPDEDLSTNAINMGVRYKDAAGNSNWTGAYSGKNSKAGVWTRLEFEVVVPSGMHVDWGLLSNAHSHAAGAKVTGVTISYGSPVTLASSAHTPYATQDHVSVTYATKASLKVTDDSVKAEVSARAQTDRNVADLSSRLTQTANSLTSEISDRRSAITTVTGLANAAQSTADGAAKQANLYRIGTGAAGASPKWIHLGTLTSAGDASSATIAIVFGDGYNGGARQNSTMTITIKDGWQSTQSATGACGVTAMRENCDNALVDVLAQSATVYDVWVYAPWAYSDGRYSISGQYAAWQHSGATQKAEPATSATQVKQDVAYRLADATKAQTMAVENQSSIKQLSSSITAEVTARTKTDRMVSEVSSRLTQTADGFSASIDRLSDTDKKVNSWFGFGSDSSGNPQLTMGSSSSPVVGVYTNTGLAYQSRSGATLLELDGASRSSTMPHVHADDVSMGNWQWVPTQNGTHLTLQWIGG